MDKKLKYELTEGEVNFILQALNRVQFASVDSASSLVHVVGLLRKPVNAEELEKDTYERLQAKFAPKKDEKKDK